MNKKQRTRYRIVYDSTVTILATNLSKNVGYHLYSSYTGEHVSNRIINLDDTSHKTIENYKNPAMKIILNGRLG